MRIAQYLKKHQLTQREFAERVGVSPALVSHWICGRTAITPRMAKIIERETKREVPREVCFE